MKYFRLTEWYIKWELTWENYILYMSSIPSYDDEPAQPAMEVRDINDIFM